MLKRLHELLLKLISVKGLLGVSSFVAAIVNPGEYTFYLAVIFGSLLVVGREYGKLLEVLKEIKGK